MSKYRVQVVMSYFQDIEVEAVSKDYAEVLAFELFAVDKAYPGEGEIRWTTCIDDEGESK